MRVGIELDKTYIAGYSTLLQCNYVSVSRVEHGRAVQLSMFVS